MRNIESVSCVGVLVGGLWVRIQILSRVPAFFCTACGPVVRQPSIALEKRGFGGVDQA